MRTKSISRMFNTAYQRRYNVHDFPQDYELASRSQYYLAKMRSATNLARHKWVQYTVILLVLAAAVGSIYYYNLLVITEQDVLAAEGKVQSLLQRRNDISINLSRAVLDYSKYEQGVFTAVVGLRSALSNNGDLPQQLQKLLDRLPASTGQPAQAAVPPPAAVGAVASPWSKLMAIAEQYPDLKLSNTFLNLMTALIEVEKDLSQERIKYNDTVNIYTTTLVKFPINIYALIFRFKARPYFEATQGAKQFQPIQY